MRPRIASWLVGHHLPVWLAPSSSVLLGVAALLGILGVLRLARRDGERIDVQASALLAGYVAAFAAGHAFESLLAIPSAIAARDATQLFAGRASYGALLGGLAAGLVVLRLHHASLPAFLDRGAAVAGFVFALLRLGCFLDGCDYGIISGGPFGLSFPAGSSAALLHAGEGLVPAGRASLPVLPTALFEAALAMASSALVVRRVMRGERSGGAAADCALVYAAGRFFLELLKEHPGRVPVLGLFAAQWVSAAIVVGCVVLRRGGAVTGVLAWARVSGYARLQSVIECGERPDVPGISSSRPRSWGVRFVRRRERVAVAVLADFRGRGCRRSRSAEGCRT